MIHHNIYKCWAPLGGHADDNTNLYEVAFQESKEESGLDDVRFVNEDILGIAILPVEQHVKRGKIVPFHLHFDVRYLLEANDTDVLNFEQKEVSDAQRFSVDKIQELDIDIMPVVQRVMKKVEHMGF